MSLPHQRGFGLLSIKLTYNSRMRLIAFIVALFGGLIIYYGISEPMIPSIAQQWTMIGGGFLFGGLFLYVYIGKKK